MLEWQDGNETVRGVSSRCQATSRCRHWFLQPDLRRSPQASPGHYKRETLDFFRSPFTPSQPGLDLGSVTACTEFWGKREVGPHNWLTRSDPLLGITSRAERGVMAGALLIGQRLEPLPFAGAAADPSGHFSPSHIRPCSFTSMLPRRQSHSLQSRHCGLTLLLPSHHAHSLQPLKRISRAP
jgi:hypothetical protein